MDARERAATLAPLLAQMTEAEREQALRVALRAARRDALEEAAGVAEAEFKRWQPSAPHSTVHASAERTAYEIMEQIRTLATSGEEGETK